MEKHFLEHTLGYLEEGSALFDSLSAPPPMIFFRPFPSGLDLHPTTRLYWQDLDTIVNPRDVVYAYLYVDGGLKDGFSTWSAAVVVEDSMGNQLVLW